MATGMSSQVARLLQLASRIICLIVIVSFAIFAVNQTSKASTHQQNELNGVSNATTTPGAVDSSRHESSVHKAIDDASGKLTSPFSGITLGSSSQWIVRGANLLLALIVYGFGLGYLARLLRVRV
jgi:hypothetical protein